MSTRTWRAVASVLLSAVLLSVAATAPVTGAQAKKDKKAQKAREAAAAAAPFETVRGKRYRMANTRIADRIVRIADVEGDQLTDEGEPAPDAPGHTDLVNVYLVAGQMPRKLLGKMDREYPRGTVGSFYGSAADWESREPLVFVAAEMAKRRPADGPGQQLQIGIDGIDAAPMEVGAAGDDVAGLSRFSLSGLFNNGAWDSGATDVRAYVPGADIDWYNVKSGVFGFYDRKSKTWYAIVPRPADTERITVAVRSSTARGEVVDRLELPGGGTFVDLAVPDGGWRLDAGLDPLSCRALETYSGSSSDPAPQDPDATLIRYTAGVTPATDPDDAASLLAPARAALGSMPMLVQAAGTDDEPLEIEGLLEAVPGVEAVTLTMEVPPGQWTFEPAEDAQVELPNGELLIDASTLTGRSGVLTGPGLDGVVAGDPSCGWEDAELADPAPPEQQAPEGEGPEA